MDLYTSSSANGLMAQATLLTLVSGYTMVAYIAGTKLTTLQVSLANLVYVGGSSSTLISNYVSVPEALNAKAQAAALEPNLPSWVTASHAEFLRAGCLSGFTKCFIHCRIAHIYVAGQTPHGRASAMRCKRW
jgi:hypothetical protein